ncbi:MAG: CRISPR-associated endonuclease Cas2 [Patescibacteria group bacterium]
MRKLEKESKKRTQKTNIQKIILETIAVAGVVSIALVAPNVLGALHTLGIKNLGRRKEAISRSRKNMVESGLLEYSTQGFLRLTEKGETKLRIIKLNNYKLHKPKRWDKKWRVIIFDIKEKRKGMREKVRRTLISIGFVRLQDSVWVYPYDCEDFVTLLKADFKIGKELLYMIVDTIENDKELKKRFGLL